MLKTYWSKLNLPTFQEQKGQSLIIFTFSLLGIIALLGLALDLGLVYIEQVRMNRTTDAATLGAVVELPSEQDAIERAIEFIRLNGYDVGQDTEILVRGCVDPEERSGSSLADGVFNSQNWTEQGVTNPIQPPAFITGTTTVTGLLYVPSIDPPKATFMIDTGSFQADDGNGDSDSECNPTDNLYGVATKIQVHGRSIVPMNFMQFFGFPEVPVEDQAIAENITSLDVMVVFDVSGSMEYETTCFDCWTRTSYDISTKPYPNNGYFNPLPYNKAWASPGDAQSIPASDLCTVFPPSPFEPVADTFYLAVEAELYSGKGRNNWDFNVRSPGQGFWVIQRGSRGNTNAIEEVGGGTTNNEANFQGNQAGVAANQSSNVCNPVAGGIDCLVGGGGGDDVCAASGAVGDIAVDCSAYIKAHVFPTYSQGPGNDPKLQGATYNIDCFTGSNDCWLDPQAPNNSPWVEYDFTPTWDGPTYIWIRARGGGDRALEWAGVNPAGAFGGWRDAVMWQVDNGAVTENTDTAASGNGWRDNRATDGEWQWIKLGQANTGTYDAGSPDTHVLKIYQGSSGYKIDKIIFTNDGSGSSGSPPANININSGKGPPASDGSATREACNVCNPAFGYEITDLTTTPIDPTKQCSCRNNANDTANSGYGAGQGCTVALQPTNYLENDLYAGLQPLRGAQEAVKRFISRLDPQFDQVGFVAFETNVVSEVGSRSKLQCREWAAQHAGGAGACYDTNLGTPISYTQVLQAVERQWPLVSTDIAEGLREALEELGVGGYNVDSSCTTGVNDGRSCDRRGAARRIIVLLTDGSPNQNPGNCGPGGGRPDLWDGLVGPNDNNYECAMYYAWEAASSNVTLYVIGLGAGVNIDLLHAMATGIDPRGGVVGDGNDVTYFNGKGGKFYNAATPEELDAIFEEILTNTQVRIVG